MRRFAAALLFVMLASLSTLDGVCCPDGCTHEKVPAHRESQSVGGLCLLCLGGMVSPEQHGLAYDGFLARERFLSPPQDLIDTPLQPLDHPPRI